MFNLNLGKKLGAAAIIALSTLSSAQAIVLDSFTWDTPVSEVTTSTTNGNGITSGSTFISNDFYPGLLPAPVTVDWVHTVTASPIPGTNSALNGGNGYINHDNGSSVVSKLTLNYYAEFQQNLIPLDFTQFGNAFYFDTLFSGEGILVDVAITDITNTTEVVQEVSNSFNAFADPLSSDYGQPQRGLVEFEEYTVVDLTNVLSIMLTFTTPGAAPDFTIAEFGITSVPEPTTLAIFGLGLLGLGLSRRRQA